MISFFKTYKPQIEVLCKQYRVVRLYAFGSVLTSDFNEKSDVDLIVAFDKKQKTSLFHHFFGLKNSLEKLFGRSVDLLEEQPIKNPILRTEIEKTKRLIYGKESPEMAL
jgi:uncharacterized protein